MGRYTTFRSEMWTDSGIEKLSIEGKALYAYLLSSPYNTIAGYYKLSIKNLKGDLCRYDSSKDEYNEEDLIAFRTKILPELISQQSLWKYDEGTSQIFIPTYLKYNKVGGPKQLKSVATQVEALTKCSLHRNFLFAVQKYTGKESLEYFSREILVYVRELCKNQESPIDIVLYKDITSLIGSN